MSLYTKNEFYNSYSDYRIRFLDDKMQLNILKTLGTNYMWLWKVKAEHAFIFFLFITLLQVFALRGRLIFGPDAGSLYLTISLIVFPVILFCSLVSQSLVNYFPDNIGLILVAIPAVFTVYVSFFVVLFYMIFVYDRSNSIIHVIKMTLVTLFVTIFCSFLYDFCFWFIQSPRRV